MEKWEIPILILKASRPPRRRKGSGTGQGAVIPWSAERIFHLPATCAPDGFFEKDTVGSAIRMPRRGVQGGGTGSGNRRSLAAVDKSKRACRRSKERPAAFSALPAVFTPAAAPSAFFGMKRGAGILVLVAGRQPGGLARLAISSFSLPKTVLSLVNGGYGFRSAPEPKGASAGRRTPRRERRIGCLYRRFSLLRPRGGAA